MLTMSLNPICLAVFLWKEQWQINWFCVSLWHEEPLAIIILIQLEII